MHEGLEAGRLLGGSQEAGGALRVWGLLGSVVRGLFPGYFAFVMATGIVSTATVQFKLPVLPSILFCIASAGYAWLLILTAARVAKHPGEILADFRMFARSPGFFTIIAGTCVLGAGVIRLYGAVSVGFALWIWGFALWVFLIYAFAISAIVAEDKPPVEKAVNGAWLIIVVATQSLSILGSLLSKGIGQEWIYFVATAMFMLGCALYLLLISLVAGRLFFQHVEPAQLAPPYWVMMGAAAITTLAGAELDKHSSAWTLRVQALPVLQGFTLLFWIVATAWLPLLVLLGVWRHIVKRHTLKYEPQLWSMVFPLGMYSVATNSLAGDFHLSFLGWVGPTFAAIALAAWLATSIGFAADASRKALAYDPRHSEAAAIPPA